MSSEASSDDEMKEWKYARDDLIDLDPYYPLKLVTDETSSILDSNISHMGGLGDSDQKRLDMARKHRHLARKAADTAKQARRSSISTGRLGSNLERKLDERRQSLGKSVGFKDPLEEEGSSSVDDVESVLDLHSISLEKLEMDRNIHDWTYRNEGQSYSLGGGVNLGNDNETQGLSGNSLKGDMNPRDGTRARTLPTPEPFTLDPKPNYGSTSTPLYREGKTNRRKIELDYRPK
jgi:hypothetical protein